MPRPKSTDTEATRQAIATAAENMFRSVGYSKTTLADVAARLGMSPANIYRFFRSKQEINGCICDRLIMEYENTWPDSIDPGAPAAENLPRLLLACHRHIRSKILSNTGVYDMFVAAAEQNWPVMLEHMSRMVVFLAGIVQAGVDRGQVLPCDTNRVATLLLQAMSPFLDPRRIARTIKDSVSLGVEEHMESDLEAIVSLLLRGLSPLLPPLAI
ncbi:MAG: hypothetical protein AUJ49_13055 [Desulfovibrionaceae bacterium CG1_02_65_16]|nr:MAG: hypothetical protein AUJ49_13055 [Desulfovibrionaceae bacterium CG1_02_65_16]